MQLSPQAQFMVDTIMERFDSLEKRFNALEKRLALSTAETKKVSRGRCTMPDVKDVVKKVDESELPENEWIGDYLKKRGMK